MDAALQWSQHTRTHRKKKGNSRRGRYHGPPCVVVAGLVLPRASGRFRRHARRKFLLFNGKPVSFFSSSYIDLGYTAPLWNTATATAERTVFATINCVLAASSGRTNMKNYLPGTDVLLPNHAIIH